MLPGVGGAGMENRIKESFADGTDELVRRISEAQTPQEFQDALDNMAVHLTAQRELASITEMFSTDGATCQHLT
jgi:hypothetical protein